MNHQWDVLLCGTKWHVACIIYHCGVKNDLLPFYIGKVIYVTINQRRMTHEFTTLSTVWL